MIVRPDNEEMGNPLPLELNGDQAGATRPLPLAGVGFKNGSPVCTASPLGSKSVWVNEDHWYMEGVHAPPPLKLGAEEVGSGASVSRSPVVPG